MRGRTLNDAFIILDEAQNTTSEQMKMFLTRLGFGSKVVVTGDVTQVDLPGGAKSGLMAATAILEGIDDIHFSRLTSQDVVRHRLVADIVDAYGRAEESPASRCTHRYRDRRQPRGASCGFPRTSLMSIELANESGGVEVPAELIIDAARFAVNAMDVNPPGALLSVLCVDEDTMADMHVQWMDLPGPTDVMSFPMDELVPGGRPDATDLGPAILGDIVLCPPEFARKQAREARRSFEHELAMLTIHGVLHLLGYDHAEPEEEREMFGLQNEILDAFYAERNRRAQEQRQTDRDSRLLSNIGFTGTEQGTGGDAGGATGRSEED